MTGIEWTDATWNPVTGCDRVSPGCEHCYAERMAVRLAGRHGYPADEPFTVTLRPDRLDDPTRWRKPRRVFVCSMGDLFHRHVPDRHIVDVFDVMTRVRRHTYQVLTKRPQRMRTLLDEHLASPEEADDGCELGIVPGVWDIVASGTPAPNIWLGTSIETDRYIWRADHLRATPATVRFLSLEPLLGPLPSLDLTGIDWVIAGGESGPGARPIHPDWPRAIRDQCARAGIPFFFKQWGGPHPKAHGRTLDGRTWNQHPDDERRTDQ